MSILLTVTDRDIRPMQEKIRELLGDRTEVRIYPDMPDPAQVKMAVLWKHPAGLLAELPNLELVSALGAGVEHILNDADLPPDVRITRIVDDALTASMRNYVVMALLNFNKRLSFFLDRQRQAQWEKPAPLEIPLRIGMLGMGALGGPIARFLASMGFEVLGYSQRPKEVEGVRCISAADEPLTAFAGRINALVCLLPRTAATEGILNYRLFSSMPQGSFLLNVARGAHLVEEDLLRAMDEGIIREACLDVFRSEPLPAGHPFWKQPGILVTPHIASITDLDKAAGIVADNYRRLLNGEALSFEVDRERGY